MNTEWEYAKARLATLMGVEPEELEEPEEEIPIQSDKVHTSNEFEVTFDGRSMKRFMIIRKTIPVWFPNADNNSTYGDLKALTSDPDNEIMGLYGSWEQPRQSSKFEAQVVIERHESDEMPTFDLHTNHPLDWKYLNTLSKEAKGDIELKCSVGIHKTLEVDEYVTQYACPKTSGLESKTHHECNLEEPRKVRFAGKTQIEVYDIGELVKRANMATGLADMVELVPANDGMVLICYNNRHQNREEIMRVAFDDSEVKAKGSRNAFRMRSEDFKILVKAMDRKGELELRWTDNAICAVHKTATEDTIHFEIKWTK